VAMPHIIDTGLKPGCNCRGGLPQWPTCQYSGRGGRLAVARRRTKKNGSDEGPGHPHLKMAALVGRLKPARKEEEEEEEGE